MKRLSLSLLLVSCSLTLTLFAQSVPTKTSQPDADLKLEDYNLYLNGRHVIESGGSVSGKVVWFCLPDKGPFVLSTNPHDGYDFNKVGVIKGNTISFTHDSNYYEWVSTSQVVSDGAERDLWLLVDEKYRNVCFKGVSFGCASPFEEFIKLNASMAARRPTN
jgi:hypothetical protein